MDNNLELMKRAKVYLEQLAKGIDPISGGELPEDSVVNNVRISRCFFYVADILQKVIDNEGKVVNTGKSNGLPFAITPEEKARVELSDSPLFISKLCDRINGQVDPERTGRLKATAFGLWLKEKGFLTEEIRQDKKRKKVTPLGESIGIASEWRDGPSGTYLAVTYSREAQQFLLDNLDEIIAISNGDKGEKE